MVFTDIRSCCPCLSSTTDLSYPVMTACAANGNHHHDILLEYANGSSEENGIIQPSRPNHVPDVMVTRTEVSAKDDAQPSNDSLCERDMPAGPLSTSNKSLTGEDTASSDVRCTTSHATSATTEDREAEESRPEDRRDDRRMQQSPSTPICKASVSSPSVSRGTPRLVIYVD